MWALGSFGAAKLLGSIAVMIYIDSAGRRIFLISGLLLMFASSGALFMLFYDSLKKVRNQMPGNLVRAHKVRQSSGCFSCLFFLG